METPTLQQILVALPTDAESPRPTDAELAEYAVGFINLRLAGIDVLADADGRAMLALVREVVEHRLAAPPDEER